MKYDIDEQIRMDEIRASAEQVTSTVKNEFSESIDEVESSFKEVKEELDETIDATKEKQS